MRFRRIQKNLFLIFSTLYFFLLFNSDTALASCDQCFPQLIPITPSKALSDEEKNNIRNFYISQFQLSDSVLKIIHHYFNPDKKARRGFNEFLGEMENASDNSYIIERPHIFKTDGNIVWVDDTLLISILRAQFFDRINHEYFPLGIKIPRLGFAERLTQGKAMGDFMAAILVKIYWSIKSHPQKFKGIRIFAMDIQLAELTDFLQKLGFKKIENSGSSIFSLDLIPK